MIKNFRYRIETLKYFSVYMKKLYFVFFMLLLGNIGIVGVTCIQPHIYQIFIDNIIIDKKVELLKQITITYVILFICKVGFDYLRIFCKNKIIKKIVIRIREKLWNNAIWENLSLVNEKKIGDKKMTIWDDVEKIYELVESQSINYLLSNITLVICSIMLIVIEWHLALLVVFIIPITLYIDYLISRKEKELLEKQRVNDQAMESWLYTATQGWKGAKILNLQKRQEREFTGFLHYQAKCNAKWINYWVMRVMVIPRFKNEFVMQFGVYFIGGLFVAGDYITIGQLLVFIAYYNILIQQMVSISTYDSELQSAMPYIDRVKRGLYQHNSKKQNRRLDIVDGIEEVVFDNVTFAYNKTERKVFQGLNVRIKKGEWIELAGKSGCGKSTFIKLLLGIEEPTKGTVYVSNKNIELLDKENLRKKISCVMQDAVLFNTTIRRNLLMVKQEATEEELEQVCRKARIWDDIMSMEKGLDTEVGERAEKLSRGQKQRLILARSFLQNADLFIFDEATSGIDPKTENEILDIIKGLDADKTILIVSHNGGLGKICSRKIVLG